MECFNTLTVHFYLKFVDIQMSTASTILLTEIIPHQKGLNTHRKYFLRIFDITIHYHCRFGWIVLVLVSAIFTFSICYNQVARFVNNPFIFTLEANYHNWSYMHPAITICTDFINDSFIDESYGLTTNKMIDNESKDYQNYRRNMKIIASLNAENVHLINAFEDIPFFKDLSGDNLLDIAYNVRHIFNNYKKMFLSTPDARYSRKGRGVK